MSEALLEAKSVETRQRRSSDFSAHGHAEREARTRRKSSAENDILARVERSKRSGHVVRSVSIEHLLVAELKSALLGDRARDCAESR